MAAGFECEFAEEVSKGIQAECPICLLVLREPYQAPCCGKSFCKECIHRIKAANQACPTCNDKDFTIFPNTGLQQSLYDFKVYCTHKSKGCKWKGELRELDNHLNSDPPADKYLQGCPFTFIKCPLSCTDHRDILRKDIKSHIGDNLDRLASFMISIKQENAQLKVQMDNNEGEKLHLEQCIRGLEEELGEHNRKINTLESKNEELEKEVKKVKEMNERLFSIEGCNQYLEQQVTELNRKISKLDEKIREYEATIELLRSILIAPGPPPGQAPSPPQGQPSSVTGTYRPKVEFIMTDFEEYQKDDDMWCSPHFYAYSNGYKMCLCVFANGFGPTEGTHLSVCVLLMKGEFDDMLKWPFCGVVYIKLMNQEEDSGHVKREAHCPRTTSIEGSGRVINAERSCYPWGLWDFLPLTALRPKYLKNNCIKLRIEKVEVF